MAIKETTPELDALLKDSETLARIPLTDVAAKSLGAAGGHVQIVRAKDGGPSFAAVVHAQELFCREMLGRGDDLSEMLRLCHGLTQAPTPAQAEATRAALADLAGPTEPWELTPEQVAACESYAQGDFSFLPELARTQGVAAYDRELRNLGDGFFAYLMRELDPREDCEPGDGLSRIRSMQDDLLQVEAAVTALDAPAP